MGVRGAADKEAEAGMDNTRAQNIWHPRKSPAFETSGAPPSPCLALSLSHCAHLVRRVSSLHTAMNGTSVLQSQ